MQKVAAHATRSATGATSATRKEASGAPKQEAGLPARKAAPIAGDSDGSTNETEEECCQQLASEAREHKTPRPQEIDWVWLPGLDEANGCGVWLGVSVDNR